MSGPVDHVALQALLRPDMLAAVDLAQGRRWTYAALHRAVSHWARALATDFGCGVGDRVACLSRNRVEVVILHLACARSGLIFVPLNWRLATDELTALIADCRPALVFGGAELAAHGLAGLDLDGHDWQPAAAVAATGPALDPQRPSLILYTSGTSGRPKGVVLSEANLGQTAINFSLLGAVTPSSVFLIDSPMFHVIGLVTSVRPPFMTGGTIVVSDGFQPARTLARMADPALGVTHYFCVPQMAAALRREPTFDPQGLRGLTAIFTGGAPHPAQDIRAWLADGIPVVDGFGMSEAGTVFGMPLSLAQIDAKAGSVGVPTPAVQARIVRPDGGACDPGEPGELLLRGANVFAAYWERPEETAAAFTPDGWFHTGDIAQVDADGCYRIVDRKKDMFISGGENVYPAEIEAALAGLAGLAECAVIGMPDAQWGEVGVCCYAPAPGAALADADLLAHLEGRIARYKLPRRFLRLAGLPRTGSGKVLKGELRALARSTHPDAPSPP